MRNAYLLLTGIGLLLSSLSARAQQPWQPFRPGLSYQLSEAATPGDTTHVLRVEAGTPVAGATTDTLFQFNGRVRRTAVNAAACSSHLQVVPDNLFGATLRSQPGSVFELAAANGRRLVLRPHAATGTIWATGLPGLTASITGRTQEAMLGSAPDSVVTIALSDGQSLRLSKRYGWLSGPSLDHYLNGRYPRRALTLTALPERGLGRAVTGAAAVYDFQPGDIFQYTDTLSTYTNFGIPCQISWQQDSVLSRRLSANGDTLAYTVRTRAWSRGFGSANAPGGFCSVPSTGVVYPPRTETRQILLHDPTDWQNLSPLTSFYQAMTSWGNYLSAAVSRPSRFAGRPEVSSLWQDICRAASPDSVYLTYILDNGSRRRYAVGLGETYRGSSGIYTYENRWLSAYAKSNGSERWGTFFVPSQLLPTRTSAPARTTAAFPNPFAEHLAATFELGRAQPVAATLRDALGRAVATVPARPLGAGPQQLALPTAGLPAGLYLLQLQFAGEARSEVLRVVKVE